MSVLPAKDAQRTRAERESTGYLSGWPILSERYREINVAHDGGRDGDDTGSGDQATTLTNKAR